MSRRASDLCSLFVSFIYLWVLTPSAGDDLTTLAPLPKFLKTDTNVTFNKGEEAKLQCAIENIGTRTVVWRRSSDPNPLTIGTTTYFRDKRLYVYHEKLSLEWNLHIRNVSLEDAGVYECQISSKTRSIRHNVLLRVEDAPFRPTFKPDIKISGPSYVEKGNELRLVCNATGDGYPPDGIDWFKDGHKITQDDRLHIQIVMSIVERTIISALYIKRATMTDAGTYVCRTSDLQITSTKVVILDTRTNNEKRDMNDDKPKGSGSATTCASWQDIVCVTLFAVILILNPR
ncbi:zwei Ig domain protein zig-8-like [Haliotis asinina]|uniref:zwei Ig domain protein zig-8-like n=1 Tax=Haliotis asinina TaxID=109174 RepID=UPI0035318533